MVNLFIGWTQEYLETALRAAKMKGVQFETPEALAKAVAAKAWGLGGELRQKTA